MQTRESHNRDWAFLGSRYRLLAKLGEGGMGTVYKVHDDILDKDVALKVLQPSLKDEMKMRFHQEAKLTAKLRHINILNVLDFGQSASGELYLVMEYIDGLSLAQLLENSDPLPPVKAIPIFCQILSGLAHAHANGILHRDIKPSNIMLVRECDGEWLVKIVDFGLAKFASNDMSLTATGLLVGSPFYMSPEQVSGGELDSRSDIYSFGCLMYKVLTGEVPFQGDSVVETLSKQASEIPKSINEISDRLRFPLELSEIVSKTLQKDPDKRYQSCLQLKEELRSQQVISGPDECEDKNLAEPPVNDTTYRGKRWSRLKFAAALLLCAAGLNIGYGAYCSHSSVSVPLASKPFLRALKSKENKIDVPGLIDSPFRRSHGPDGIMLKADKRVGDGDLIRLNEFDTDLCKRLNLEFSKVTGVGFSRLADKPIEELNLAHTKIDDRAIPEIARCRTINALFIEDTAVTDEGLKALPNLRLNKLRLDGCSAVTDRGLNEIAGLKDLTVLGISRCPRITANGIKKLKALKKLEHIYISPSTAIPERSIRRLAALMPKVKFELVSKTSSVVRHDLPLPKMVQLTEWLKDPGFRRFWRNKKNWHLTAAEVAKTKDARIRRCYEDAEILAYIRDPAFEKRAQDPNAWGDIEMLDRNFEMLFPDEL